MNWYLVALKKYAIFSGRARRKEYWYFVLFDTLIAYGLYPLELLAGFANPYMGAGVAVLIFLYALATIVPCLAVLVRRLHDTGRSGWWGLLAFIPLIGQIILIVFLATDGTGGPNKYGPDPKETPIPA